MAPAMYSLDHSALRREEKHHIFEEILKNWKVEIVVSLPMYNLDHSARRLIAKAGAEHLDVFSFFQNVISPPMWSP